MSALQKSVHLLRPTASHSQVNDFLKLLAHTGVVERLATAAKPNDRPLRVLDCGCGSSHLTFGTYHYLTHVLGLNSSLEGVDFNAGLMERSNAFRCV